VKLSLQSVGRGIKSIFTAAREYGATATAMLSVVPMYLRGLKWLIDDKFLTLIKEGYKQNSVVYSCLNLLARSVPEPPLRIYGVEDDGVEREIRDHPCRSLISNPNEMMTEFEMWELVALHLGVVGRSFWYKERGNGGLPMALWPLRPDRMHPIYSESGLNPLGGWLYNLAGIWYVIDKADIVYYHFPDPGGETGGLVEACGPLGALAREVDSDNAATNHVFGTLDNAAMPGVVITTKTKLQPGDAEIIKREFKQALAGNNIRGVAVVDEDTKIAAQSFNLRELEFPTLRSVGEARIAAAFGVPPILVGLKAGLDRATYSNAEQARTFFTETTLGTYWRRIQDVVQGQILNEFDKTNLLISRFDTSRVRALVNSARADADRYAEGFKLGAVTVDEYRTRTLQLDPLETGGDVRLLPTGVTEVGLLTPEEASLDTDVRGAKRRLAPAKQGYLRDYTPARLEGYNRNIRGYLTP
jgi:HK97 family phage portal protein